MRKGDKLFLILFLGLVITSFIFNIAGNNINDGKYILAFGIIVIVLWVIFLIAIVVTAKTFENKNNESAKIIANYIEEGNYEKAVVITSENIKNAYFSNIELKNKIILVLVEMLRNNNDQAKVLIDNTSWGRFVINIYYYRALIHLRDDEVMKSKELFDKLKGSNRKNKMLFSDQIYNLEKLIKHIEEDTSIEIKSSLPIVKELINN